MNTRIRVVLLLAGVIVVLGGIDLWVGIVQNSVAAIGGPVSEMPFGRDLRAITGAGDLAAHRMESELYDNTSLAYVASGSAEFVYPPWFAILMIPLSVIPFQLLFPIWTIVSVALLVWVLTRMDVRRRSLVTVAVLITTAGVAGLYFGQTSFMIVAGLLWALLALESERWAVSGVAVALLAFKPHLLVGIGVWWLADVKQRWREIAAALSATLVLVVASTLWLPGSWGAFAASISDAGRLVEPGFETTLMSSLRVLLVGQTNVILSLYALLAGSLLWGLVVVVRRDAQRVRVLASLAISIALLISVHGLPYDWLMLVIAGGLLLGQLDLSRDVIGSWGLVLGSALVVDYKLFTWQMAHFGFAIQTASWALLVATVLVMLRVLREQVSVLDSTPVAPQDRDFT